MQKAGQVGTQMLEAGSRKARSCIDGFVKHEGTTSQARKRCKGNSHSQICCRVGLPFPARDSSANARLSTGEPEQVSTLVLT